MPDRDESAWVARLKAHADGYEVDLDALRDRLAAEMENSAPTGRDRVPSRPLPAGRGRASSHPIPAAAGRRRLAPAVIAAAVIAAFTTAVAVVPQLAGRSGGAGVVEVQGATPHPDATSMDRPDLPGLGPASPRESDSSSAPATGPGGSPSGHGPALPSTFRWTSTGPLIGPKPDATHPVSGIKDPSVVYFGGTWHLFATATTARGGYALVYLSFTDWSQAGSATPHYLDRSGIGPGYRAAPQVFWFAPQKLWYLVYQSTMASYSTNPDITDPAGWTAPRPFYDGTPPIITRNIGKGYWVDMWVICDATSCHLFSSDDNGHLYRSQTSIAAFPQGMSQPVIAAEEPRAGDLFEGSSVYRIAGTDLYLLLVEAFAPDGTRYLRSWTSTSPAGRWTPLAAAPDSPFAGAANVAFEGAGWTRDVLQGELLRSGHDQTLTVDPCGLRYLYHAAASGAHDPGSRPWRVGLLTQTAERC
jgi:endo-1,4-beta-xylanase